MIKNAVNESMFQSNKFIVCVRFAWIGVLVMQLFFSFLQLWKKTESLRHVKLTQLEEATSAH
jgi:hypothetical protein